MILNVESSVRPIGLTTLLPKMVRARKRNKGRSSTLIVLFTSCAARVAIYTRIPIIPIVKLIFFIIHYRSRHRARAILSRFCAFHGFSFRGQKFEDIHPTADASLPRFTDPHIAFLFHPSFLFSSSSSSSSFLLYPGAFIVHRTACMHARPAVSTVL